MLVRTSILVVLLILLGYGAHEAWPLVSGPEITLTSPAPGQTFPEGFVAVTGTALHTRDLTLNGAPLLIDEQGAFSTTLVLPRGGAILSLTATDRFGKSATLTESVFVP